MRASKKLILFSLSVLWAWVAMAQPDHKGTYITATSASSSTVWTTTDDHINPVNIKQAAKDNVSEIIVYVKAGTAANIGMWSTYGKHAWALSQGTYDMELRNNTGGVVTIFNPHTNSKADQTAGEGHAARTTWVMNGTQASSEGWTRSHGSATGATSVNQRGWYNFYIPSTYSFSGYSRKVKIADITVYYCPNMMGGSNTGSADAYMQCSGTWDSQNVSVYVVTYNPNYLQAYSFGNICENDTRTLTPSVGSGSSSYFHNFLSYSSSGGSIARSGNNWIFTAGTVAGTASVTTEVDLPATHFVNIDADYTTDGQTRNIGTVRDYPSVSASNGSVCAGTNYDLNSRVNPTGGTFSGPGVSGSTFNNSTAGTHQITYSYTSNGCTTTRTFNMTVNARPNVSASSNGPVCTGSQITLSASGANTYNWYNGSGSHVGSGSTYRYNISSNETFSVTGTTSAGCTNTATVTATRTSNPSIGGITGNTSICPGGSTTLTVGGTDYGTSYRWSPNVGNRKSVTVSPSSTTTYNVHVDNGCTSNTQSVTVTVNPRPSVGLSTSKSNVCPGETFTLTGSGASSYHYYKNGVRINNTAVSGSLSVSTTSNASYYAVGYNASGCSNTSSTRSVTVRPASANAGSDVTICRGQSTTLSGSGGVSYSWIGSDGTSYSGASPSVSPTTTTNYTLTVTNTYGCTDTDVVRVNVTQLPNVTISSSESAICIGESISLTAGGASTYSWTGSNLATNSGAVVTATPGVTNTYTVTGTQNGCSSSNSLAVTVNPLPIADAGVDVEKCSYETVQLSATQFSGSFSYQWNAIGGGGSFETATNQREVDVSATTDKNYRVTVTNDITGCEANDVVFVKSNTVVPNAGSDLQVCLGESAQFGATGGVGFFWRRTSPGSSFLNNDAVSSPISTPSAAGTYEYEVTVTTAEGCVGTDVMNLEVKDLPNINISPDVNICKGTSTVLTASGADNFDWTPTSGLNVSTLANVTASPPSTTIYTVEGTTDGCTNTEQVVVFVNDIPSADAGDNELTCSGDNIVLNGLATGGNGPYSYAWTGTGIVSGGATDAVTVQTTQDRSYNFEVTDANGCVDTDVVEVNVTTATANAGVDQIICIGDQTQFVADGGVSYQWRRQGAGGHYMSDPNTSSPIVTPSETGVITYEVDVTDGNGCVDTDVINLTIQNIPSLTVTADQTICKGESVILTASGAASYDWSPSTGLNVSNLGSVTASPSRTTVYTVTGQNAAGCEVSTDVVVYVNDLPNADAGSDVETCRGEPVQLTGIGTSGGVGPYSYAWSGPGLTNANTMTPTVTTNSDQTYFLTVTDANGCSHTDQVNVTVTEAIANAGTNVSICRGETIQLGASGGSTYSWDNASGTLNDASVSNPVASPTNTTTYTVTVTNNDGCVDTDQVTVTVEDKPALTVTSDQTICKNESVQLTATGANSYDWSPSTGLDVDNVGTVNASPQVTTVYTVKGFNLAGCMTEDTVIVYVNDLPIADAGGDKDVCVGEDITITGNATGAGPFSYSWSGTGIVSGSNSQTATVNITANQTYTLTVTDANGCSSTDLVDVSINNAPNAFISVDGFVTTNTDICIGTTVELEAFGGSNYLWSGDPGLSNPAIGNPTIVVNNTKNLSVQVTNANGCVSTASITLNAVNNPTVDAGEVLNLCEDGVPYDLRADVNIQGGTFTGEGVTGDFLFDPQSVEPGIYIVTYDVVVGSCTGTTTREINVRTKPTVTASDIQSICAGDDVQISASGAVSYEWSPKLNIDDAYIAAPYVSPTQTTTYTVTGTDVYGCSSTASVTVLVNDLAVNAGVNQEICFGDGTQLDGNASKSNVSYSWLPVDGLNDPSIANPTATPSTTTTYTLTVTDAEGCSVSDEVTVSVDPKPVLEVGAPIQVCASDGNPIDLRNDVNITGGIFTSTSNGLDGVLFDASQEEPGIYFVDYTVVVGLCELVGTREIEVLPNPAVSLNSDRFDICSGESAQLLVSGGVNYSYFPTVGISDPTSPAPLISPSTTTDYIVTVSDVNGCETQMPFTVNVQSVDAFAGNDVTICEGESIQLRATGGRYYSWDNTTTLSNANIDDPLASPLTTTTYQVTVTDNDGCVGTDQVIVYVNPAPNLDVGPKLTLCHNDVTGYDLRNDVNLSNPVFTSASSALEGVQFFPDKDNVGIHFVDVTISENGCTITKTKEIEIVAPNQVTTNVSTVNLCLGETRQISAANAVSYRWVPEIGLSDPNVYNPIISVTENTVFTVYGTDINGCETSAEVEVIMDNEQVFAGADLTICKGETIRLDASGSDSYSWDNVGSLDNPNIRNPFASPTSTTTYTVSGTNAKGCVTTDQIIVTVLEPTIINLGAQVEVCRDAAPFDVRVYENISGGQWTSSSRGLDGILFDPSKEDPGVVFLEYTLIENGCETSGVKEIRILESPTVGIIEDREICLGESVQLSASGGVSYSWYPSNGTISDPAVFNPIVTPTSTTTYFVDITDLNGCSSTASVEVVVNEPNTSINPDVTICAGESVQLTASGGRTYTWSNPGLLDDANIADPIASPMVTTDFTVSIVDNNGCTSTESVRVLVNETPELSVGAPLELCLNGGEIYDLRDDVSVSGGVFTSESNGLVGVTFDPAQVSSPGIYFVDYTVTIGQCSVTKTREVRVIGDPVIVSDFESYEICAGESAQLSVSGGSSYEWIPKANIDNAFTNQPNVSPEVTTTYTVKVSNDNGCIATKSIEVIVNDVVANAGSDVTICYGDGVELEGSGGVNYSWSGGGLSSNLAKPFVEPLVTTTYSLEVTSAEGCVDIDAVTVNVIQPITVSAGSKLTLCNSDNFAYDLRNDVSHNGGVFTSVSSGLSGVYFEPYNVIPGVYFVDYTYQENGCDYVATREIEVKGEPNVALAIDEFVICKGDSIQPQFVEGAGLFTYEWKTLTGISDVNVKDPWLKPERSTDYIVEITDPTLCTVSKSVRITVNDLSGIADPDVSICEGDSYELGASGGVSYVWEDGNLSGSNPVVSPLTTTTYKVDITNAAGCVLTDSMTINVIPAESVSAGPNLSLCTSEQYPYDLRSEVSHSGGTFDLRDNSTGLNGVYLEPYKLSPGLYFLDYTVTINGCEYTSTREVEVYGDPAVTLFSSEYVICRGDSVQPQFIEGAGTFSYTWENSGSISQTDIKDPWLKPTASQDYTVTIQDDLGCSMQRVISVQVNDLTGAAGPDVTICEGESYELNASGGVAYIWENGTLSGANPIVTPLTTTTYEVEITNSEGCSLTDFLTVNVTPAESVTAGANLTLCSSDQYPYDLRDDVSHGGGTFELRGNSSGLNGVYMEPYNLDPGLYFIDYTVTVNGCEYTTTREVEVKGDPIVTLPRSEYVICRGDSVQPQFNEGAGTFSYAWENSGSISQIDIKDPWLKPTTSQDYTVTIQDDLGCSMQKVISVQVNDLTGAAGPDVTICEGESYELNASGGVAYLWENGTLSGANPIVTPLVSTTYEVEITNSEGCSLTDFLTVNVTPAETVTAGANLTLCSSDQYPYDLRDDVSHSGGTFELRGNSSGLNGVYLEPYNLDAGLYFIDYTVTVNGCDYTTSREIEVKGDPIVSLPRSEYIICRGDSVQPLFIEGAGTFTYAWDNSGSISQIDIKDPWLKPTTSQDYTVTIQDDLGCSMQKVISVQVNDLTGAAGPDVTICEGESYELNASGGVAYLWENGALSGVNPIVTPLVTTTYEVEITNSEGCSLTDFLTVNVTPAETVTAGANLTLCSSDQYPYDLRDDVSHSGGTFELRGNSSGLNGVYLESQSLEPGLYFIDYTVTVNGCEYTSSREIEIKGDPAVSAPRYDYVICRGDSIQPQFNEGIGTFSYTWENSGSISQTDIKDPWLSPTTSQEYSVRIEDELGCSMVKTVSVIVNTIQAKADADLIICEGEQTILTAQGGISYTWNGGQLNGVTSDAPTVSPSESTTYFVDIVNENGCSLSDSIRVSVIPSETVTIGDNLVFCASDDYPYDLRADVSHQGGTFQIRGNSRGLNGVYLEPFNLSPGLYFIDYDVQVNGCLYSATREIEVRGEPVVYLENDNINICKGDSIQANFFGSGTLNYDWTYSPYIRDHSIGETFIVPTRDTELTVTISDTLGCEKVMNLSINVEEYSFGTLRNQEVCQGDAGIDLSEIHEGDWYGEHISNNRFTPDLAGDYWIKVRASNNNGCYGVDSLQIKVHEKPAIDFSGEKSIAVCINDDIVDLNEYLNQITGARWSGDGVTTSGLFDPSKAGAGTFLIAVELENKAGCKVTEYMSVKVNRLPAVDAGPNISVCLAPDTIDISALALPAGGYFFGTGIVDNKYFVPDMAGEGDHEIFYNFQDTTTGCTATDKRIINVLEPTPVFAGAPLSICIDSGPVDLTEGVSPEGGVFYSETGINGTKFFPSTGVGTYEITYTITDETNCQNTAVRTITVNERPTLEISPAEIAICQNEGIINLNEFVNIKGGEWSGSGGIVDGLLESDSLELGTNVLSYMVSTADGCDISGQLIVNTQEIEDVDIGEDLITCQSGDKIDLLEGYNKEYVSVSGTGIDSDGMFFPSQVEKGTHLIKYEFVNRNGCVSTESKSILVQGEVFVSAGQDLNVCNNVGTLDLSGFGIPAGGVWSGGNVLLDEFVAQDAAIGEHSIFYTVDLGGGCSNTDTLLINVTSSDISDFGNDTLLCVNASELILNMNDQLAEGTWSGVGVVNNIFYPAQAGPGVWTLNYSSDAFECDVAGQRIITVIDLPEKAITEKYSISGCTGDIIRLTADMVDQSLSQAISYIWYREDGSLIAEGKTIEFKIEESENVFFSSINQFGCMSAQQDFIRITSNGPVGDFEVDKDSIAIGELVTFTAKASNTKAYRWDYGDGNHSDSEIGRYYYYETGYKDVAVTLYSPDDCEYQIMKEKMVYVYEPISEEDRGEALGIDKEIEMSIWADNVQNELIVETEEPVKGNIKLFSVSGRSAGEKNINGTRQRFDLSGVSNGMYFVILEGNGQVKRKKIIIRQ